MKHFPVYKTFWVSYSKKCNFLETTCQTNKITTNVFPTGQTQLSEQRMSCCWDVKALWVPSMHCSMNKLCSYCYRIIVFLFADIRRWIRVLFSETIGLKMICFINTQMLTLLCSAMHISSNTYCCWKGHAWRRLHLTFSSKFKIVWHPCFTL